MGLKSKITKFFIVKELKKYDTAEEIILAGKDKTMDPAFKAALLIALATGLQVAVELFKAGESDIQVIVTNSLAAIVSTIVAFLTKSPRQK